MSEDLRSTYLVNTMFRFVEMDVLYLTKLHLYGNLDGTVHILSVLSQDYDSLVSKLCPTCRSSHETYAHKLGIEDECFYDDCEQVRFNDTLLKIFLTRFAISILFSEVSERYPHMLKRPMLNESSDQSEMLYWNVYVAICYYPYIVSLISERGNRYLLSYILDPFYEKKYSPHIGDVRRALSYMPSIAESEVDDTKSDYQHDDLDKTFVSIVADHSLDVSIDTMSSNRIVLNEYGQPREVSVTIRFISRDGSNRCVVTISINKSL